MKFLGGSCKWVFLKCSEQGFSTGVGSDPQGMLGDVWRQFWPSQLEMLLASGGQRPGMWHTSYSAQEGLCHRMIQPWCQQHRGPEARPAHMCWLQ